MTNFKSKPFQLAASGIIVASGANTRLNLHGLAFKTSGAAQITISDGQQTNLIQYPEQNGDLDFTLPFSPVPWGKTSGALATPIYADINSAGKTIGGVIIYSEEALNS